MALVGRWFLVAGDAFDFSDFGFEMGKFEAMLMPAIVHASKYLSMLREEHVKNGFSEEQAMSMVLSIQRDLSRAVAFTAAELGKAMIAVKAQSDGD